MLFDVIITKEDMESPNGTSIIGHNIMISKNGVNVVFQKDALLQFLEDIKTLNYLKND